MFIIKNKEIWFILKQSYVRDYNTNCTGTGTFRLYGSVI